MKRIALLVLLAPAVFLATNSWAAPAITSVTGTISNNQSVTVAGSGFGTKSTAAPILWDTVDNQSSYGGLTNGVAIPTGSGYPWADNTNTKNLILYDNAAGDQRGVSTACYKANPSYAGGTLGDLLLPKSSPQLYISWWWKTDTQVGTGTMNDSSKYLRVSDQSNLTNSTFSWTEWQNIVYQNPSSCDVKGIQDYCVDDWTGWSPTANIWHHLEALFDNSAKTYTLMVDGSAVTTQSFSPGTLNFNEIWKVGFDGGGNNPPSITQWMDDIYVDNSVARVMICNGSTFSGSTHCENQIPSAWSASSVTVAVNQGSFASNAPAYLYVADSTNTANAQGYPITFGGASTSSAPTVTITSPSSSGSYTSYEEPITVSGSAGDSTGLSSITWSNSLGGSGSVSGVSGTSMNWSIANINLSLGQNVITVTVTDASNKTSTAKLTINYLGPPPPPGLELDK